jgi:hypothetical protein
MLIPIANPDQDPVKSTSTGFDVSGSHNILVWIRIHVREAQKHGYSDPDPQHSLQAFGSGNRLRIRNWVASIRESESLPKCHTSSIQTKENFFSNPKLNPGP